MQQPTTLMFAKQLQDPLWNAPIMAGPSVFWSEFSLSTGIFSLACTERTQHTACIQIDLHNVQELKQCRSTSSNIMHVLSQPHMLGWVI